MSGLPVGSSSTTPDEGGECWCTHPSHVGPCRVMVDLGTLSARLCLCGGPSPFGPRVVVGHPNEAGEQERRARYLKAIRWTDVAGNWDVSFAVDKCMALADAEQSELRAEVQRARDKACDLNVRYTEAAIERDAALARLAAIQALCDEEWRDGFGDFVQALRTILAGGVVDG